jgi:hypothetical protein
VALIAPRRCELGVAVDVADGVAALLHGGGGDDGGRRDDGDVVQMLADAAYTGPGPGVGGDVTLERCAVGGEDTARWARATHAGTGLRRAVSAVDVSGGSACRAWRCTLEDTEVRDVDMVDIDTAAMVDIVDMVDIDTAAMVDIVDMVDIDTAAMVDMVDMVDIDTAAMVDMVDMVDIDTAAMVDMVDTAAMVDCT